MKRYYRYLATLILAIASLAASAQNAEESYSAAPLYADGRSNELNSSLVDEDSMEDTVSVSVLTCSPGKELYSRFGHTAIRVRMTRQYIDIVLNYGCFNYNSDNFVIKFLLGQTDYLLEGESYDAFIRRYEAMGQSVTEQVLNLTSEEKDELISLIRENLRPENQEYRYVWLYDNCTERARDIIEKSIQGKVVYRRAADSRTVRMLLRDALTDSPWVMFGLDLILGQEIDAAPDRRVQMFLPLFYSHELDSAVLQRNGQGTVSMVKKKQMALKSTMEKESSGFIILRPSFVFLAMFILFIMLSAFEISRSRYMWGIDVLLHSVQGLAGMLVAFLFFFSTHPGTDSNWLVIMFNPLWLVYACWVCHCQRKGLKNRFGLVNAVITAAFIILMTVCGQSFKPSMYFLMLSLLLRAIQQVYFMRRPHALTGR